MCSFPLFTRKPKDDSVCLLHCFQTFNLGLGPSLFGTSWTFSNTFFYQFGIPGCYRKLKEVAINFFNTTIQRKKTTNFRGESLLHISRWCCDLDESDCVWNATSGGIKMWRFSTALRLHTHCPNTWRLKSWWNWRCGDTIVYIDSCFFSGISRSTSVQNLYIMHGTAWWNHTLHPGKTRH